MLSGCKESINAKRVHENKGDILDICVTDENNTFIKCQSCSYDYFLKCGFLLFVERYCTC